MARPGMPFCDVEKYTPFQAGNVVDWGHCFTDQPAAEIYNPDYTFAGRLLPAWFTGSFSKRYSATMCRNEVIQCAFRGLLHGLLNVNICQQSITLLLCRPRAISSPDSRNKYSRDKSFNL